jgi:drug/metabolite transporter (DMT)-like permease
LGFRLCRAPRVRALQRAADISRLRNAGALALLAAIAIGIHGRENRLTSPGCWWSGALLQGFSVALMYWSVYHGIPAGIAALMGGLQPAITAVLAAGMLGEALEGMQWTGIVAGLAGVALVVSPKLGGASSAQSLELMFFCFLGVVSIAYGSLYQKRFNNVGDAWTRNAIMFAGALIASAIGAALFERGDVDWQPVMIAVYAWSVIALAVGATMALLFLIQRGEAARASSLIYLVPPVSALMAYLAFGETINAVQIAGFVVAAIGVALVQRDSRKT